METPQKRVDNLIFGGHYFQRVFVRDVPNMFTVKLVTGPEMVYIYFEEGHLTPFPP